MYKEVLFYILAIICVVTAVVTITRRNPVYAAFFLIGHLVSVAATISLFRVPYLTAIHILVYTGAIMVLFLFIIMLLNLKEEEMGEELPVLLRSLYLLAPVIFVLVAINISPVEPIDFSLFKGVSLRAASGAIFNKYVFGFELVSALILVAIIGSVVVAKKDI